jgi:DNA polymerase-3 subunit delta'
MQQHAQVVHPSEVRRYLYTLQRLTTYLHHTVNTRLALEVLLLRLPSLSAATGGAAH